MLVGEGEVSALEGRPRKQGRGSKGKSTAAAAADSADAAASDAPPAMLHFTLASLKRLGMPLLKADLAPTAVTDAAMKEAMAGDGGDGGDGGESSEVVLLAPRAEEAAAAAPLSAVRSAQHGAPLLSEMDIDASVLLGVAMDGTAAAGGDANSDGAGSSSATADAAVLGAAAAGAASAAAVARDAASALALLEADLALASEVAGERRSSGRKRAIGGANGGGYFTANYEDESLHMLKCDPYADLHPGSGLPGAQPFRVTVAHASAHHGAPPCLPTGAQPFRVTVDPLVLAVVDFHAHMLSSEIIGFLGGHWDSSQVR